MTANSFISTYDYKLNILQENIEFIVYSIVCFFVPLLFGNQFAVGIVVNCMLILASLNLKNYKMVPAIIFPSLGVLTAGVVFGNFTGYLVYLIPVIWTGNMILVFSMKYFFLQKNINRWIVLLIGSLAKASFLFIAAYIFFNLICFQKFSSQQWACINCTPH
jgi:hypothetical protein